MASASAMAIEPLKYCADVPAGIRFSTDWYRFRGVEDYFICSKCYDDYVKGTRVASFCDPFYNQLFPGQQAFCDFNSLPKMRKFVRDVQQSGDKTDLMNFVRRRATQGICCGTKGIYGGTGAKWFYCAELPPFVACEPCYEDYIVGTPFASRFGMRNPSDHGPASKWSCDPAVPYIKRCLREYALENRWMEFVNATRYRMEITSCEPQAVSLSSRRWFRPMKPWPIQNFMMCEACLLDHAGRTRSIENFTQVTIPPNSRNNTYTCDNSVIARAVMTELFLPENYGKWHSSMARIMAHQPCSRGSINNGECYVLRPSGSGGQSFDFDICGPCFIAFFENFDMTDAFVRKFHPPSPEKVCDLGPHSGRQEEYFFKWQEAAWTGSVRPFIDYAARISGLPLCSRSASLENRPWWGMNEFFFCPACFEEVGRTSYFAPQFIYKGQIQPQACCDMYTDNMRSRYAQACKARDLGPFMGYCRERGQVRALLEKNIKFKQDLKGQINRSNRSNLQFAAMNVMQTKWNDGFAASLNGQGYNSFTDPYVWQAQSYYNSVQQRALRPSVADRLSPAEIKIRAMWMEME